MGKTLTNAERRLMAVTTKSEFNKIIEELNITEQQKAIAIMYYSEGKRMIDIAYSSDLIHINEQGVSNRLKDFALKLQNYFNEIEIKEKGLTYERN